MSNFLPYNFTTQPVSTSPTVSSTNRSHEFTTASTSHSSSSHPATLVFQRPESSSPTLQSTPSSSCLFVPSVPSHHSLTVAEWAGTTRKPNTSLFPSAPIPESGDWHDVHNNIKRMDQLYDATFYSWLKSEDNVLVTAMYLHRIANEYPLERITNALKWLVADWRWESTSILVRHVTVDWYDEAGDIKRACLLRELTQNWATQYTATLITTILATPPYVSTTNAQRERFLRSFAQDWDFSKLSEFFMYLQSRANIDYKLKCIMLQEAAKRERETLSAKLYSRMKRAKSKKRQEKSSMQLDNNAMSPTSSSTENTTNNSNNSCHDSGGVADDPMDTDDDVTTEPMKDLEPCTTTTASVTTDEQVHRMVDQESGNGGSSSSSSSSSSSNSSSTWRHHRRTSSNDTSDMNKRFRLSRSDLEPGESENCSSSLATGSNNNNATCSTVNVSTNTITTTITTTTMTTATTVTTTPPSVVPSDTITNTRRAATPDHAYRPNRHHHHHHHHYHHHIRSPAIATASTSYPVSNDTSSTGSNNERQTNDANGIGSDFSNLHLGFAAGSMAVNNAAASASTSTSSSTSTSHHHHHRHHHPIPSSSPTTPTTSTAPPTASATFSNSSRHTCYPTSSSASQSHLQIHNFRLRRRRSSSSSSTGSTGSIGSTVSHPATTTTTTTSSSTSTTATPMDQQQSLDDDGSSNMKKRATPVNQETHVYR